MENPKSKHLIFSDESGYDGTSRYGSLAKVSGSYQDTKELNERLGEILAAYKKEEIKFKRINNHHTKNIANDFLRTGFEFLYASRIKVHVLVWDKHDLRHSIKNRCDIGNMKRMYYHNLKVLLSHWNINTTWEFYPDEFSAIEWEEDLIKYIENKDFAPKDNYHYNLFEIVEKANFKKFNRIKELESNKYPIIQLADLYAGLVRTSRRDSDDFIRWYNWKKQENQPSLFGDLMSPYKVSNSVLYKYEVMLDFKRNAEKYRMGISLSENKYFKTFNKKNNIFIWHYEPQGEYDKAPTK